MLLTSAFAKSEGAIFCARRMLSRWSPLSGDAGGYRKRGEDGM